MRLPDKDYITGFDYLRVAAAFAVVWIHACDTSAPARRLAGYFAYFSVPCFLMMAAYLAQRRWEKDQALGWYDLIRLRLKRLLPAFLGWTVIYLSLRYAKRFFLGEAFYSFNPVSILFMGGAAYHLYFLPMLLYCTALFTPVLISMRHKPGAIRWKWMFGIGLVILAVTTLYHPVKAPSAYAMLNHMYWMAGFYMVGAAAAIKDRAGESGLPPRTWAALLFILAIVGVYLLPGIGRFPLIIQATAIFFLSLYLPLQQAPALIRRMSRASYGIYLAHGIFVEGLQMVFARAGVDLAHLGSVVTIILLSFLSAYALTEILLRFKGTRWLAA